MISPIAGLSDLLLPGDPGFNLILEKAPCLHKRNGTSFSVLPDENGIPYLYQGEELREALLGGYYEYLVNGDNLFDPDGIKEDIKLFESGIGDNIHYAIDI